MAGGEESCLFIGDRLFKGNRGKFLRRVPREADVFAAYAFQDSDKALGTPSSFSIAHKICFVNRKC